MDVDLPEVVLTVAASVDGLTGIKLGDLLNGFAGVTPQQPAEAAAEVTGPVLEPAA